MPTERLIDGYWGESPRSFSNLTNAASMSAMTPGSAIEAMRAMMAELDRSVASIPATQIVIMARVDGPPENLAVTGGNVFIAFPRRNPIDFGWILSLLKDVKAVEMQILFGNGFRRFEIPARRTDGNWAMVDLFKLDRSALPDGWTPLCEVDPSAYIRESIVTRCM